MNFIDIEAACESSEDDNFNHVNAREESDSEAEDQSSVRGEQRLPVRSTSLSTESKVLIQATVGSGGTLVEERDTKSPEIDQAERDILAETIDNDETDVACEGFARSLDVKKNRVSSRWVMLTYPSLGERPDVELYRKFFESIGACSAIIGTERHKSGKWHVHALVENPKKWECTLRRFDYGKHPNVRSVLPGKFEGAEEYVCKDGDFIKWNCREVPASSRNYLKRKADKDCWLRDVRASRFPKEVGPIDLPDGSGNFLPDEFSKRRGLIVVGSADQGKTSWLLHELRGTRYYSVGNDKHPWDGYDGSRVIVWNDADFWPTKQELTFFTDLGLPYHRGGYLRARFFDKFVEPGNYTLIILCNQDKWEPCPYRYEQWFLSRFKLITVNSSWSCTDENCICLYKRKVSIYYGIIGGAPDNG